MRILNESRRALLMMPVVLACSHNKTNEAPVGRGPAPVNSQGGTSRNPDKHVYRDSDGWTVVTPAGDSRMVHVSSSAGRDTNDGSESAPLRTIAAGLKQMRPGYPDWLLLKAGDEWEETIWATGGRNADQPQVFSRYGSGRRPMIVGKALEAKDKASHVAVMDLEFYDRTRDPSSVSFQDGVKGESAISWHWAGGDLLVEGCVFRFQGVVIDIQQHKGEYVDGIQIRRNTIADAYGRSLGGFFSQVRNMLIEENTFDHNGWIVDPKVAPTGFNVPNMYNHDLYLSGSFRHVVIRGNAFMRVSSLSVKMVNYYGEPRFSSDVLVENNFFFEGEVGIAVDCDPRRPHTSEPCFEGLTIKNNVFLQTNRDTPTKREIGWGITMRSVADSIIQGNLFTDLSFTSGTFAISINGKDDTDVSSNITVDGNTLYRIRDQGLVIAPRPSWGKLTISHNTIQDPDLGAAMVTHRGSFLGVSYSGNTYSASTPSNFATVTDLEMGHVDTLTYDQWVSRSGETGSQVKTIRYADPGRNLESYLEKEVGTSMADFHKDIRAKQQKGDWNVKYTARAINDYLRAGFGLEMVP